METGKPKDKRINIRLDEDTFYAIKKVVENDLKTDISSYCRSLLWISTLHDSSIRRIKTAVKRYDTVKDTEDMEYMITIKNEIKFIENFLVNLKENRKKFDDFISMTEKWHETIKDEARKYFKIYNEQIEYWKDHAESLHGEDHEEDPTKATTGYEKIEI